MIRRLRLYEFFFRLFCFLLPVLAFLVAGAGLRALELIHLLSHDYFYLCVTLTLVWIVCSAHFEVTSLEALFLDSNGAANCLKAVAWTYMSGLSALFFYRVPVFELEQFMSQNLNHLVDDIVIAVSPEILPVISRLVNRLRDFAIPIRIIMDFGNELKVRDRIFRIGGTNLLDVHIAPSETISYVILKRSFDIAPPSSYRSASESTDRPLGY